MQKTALIFLGAVITEKTYRKFPFLLQHLFFLHYTYPVLSGAGIFFRIKWVNVITSFFSVELNGREEHILNLSVW